MRAEAETLKTDIADSISLLRRHLDWEAAVVRLQELNARAEDPSLWNKAEEAQAVMRERNRIAAQVEGVLQHVAVRFDEERERRLPPHRLEQVLRLESLHPQGQPAARGRAREDERPCGIHAEAGAEERGRADFVGDASFRLVGGERRH